MFQPWQTRASSSEDRGLFSWVDPLWWVEIAVKPFHSQVQKVHSHNLPQEKCMSEVVRIGSIIIFHYLSKLWKTKFSILWDVRFLVRLHKKFETYHLLSLWASGSLVKAQFSWAHFVSVALEFKFGWIRGASNLVWCEQYCALLSGRHFPALMWPFPSSGFRMIRVSQNPFFNWLLCLVGVHCCTGGMVSSEDLGGADLHCKWVRVEFSRVFCRIPEIGSGVLAELVDMWSVYKVDMWSVCARYGVGNVVTMRSVYGRYKVDAWSVCALYVVGLWSVTWSV